ncbi:hypothetical protein HOLleu_31403 [Holothuria leucospilota]|uniref:Uncharacterized protein n=1 Tax=Holothuria leucospilota TaxID=206669 RepID=A0A9Q0YQE2_HOLLE|nr:hypothetical protein HOLleu_31403 [Holothuria leucospilota]
MIQNIMSVSSLHVVRHPSLASFKSYGRNTGVKVSIAIPQLRYNVKMVHCMKEIT